MTSLSPLRLGVNIDHVATLRNARGGADPDPVRAAALALEAGADGITAHLREDRRHIRDADIAGLAALCRERGRPLNLEMAAMDEMTAVALATRPRAVCLVPERREEVTTEGGLDVVRGGARLAALCARLREEGGARVSLFVEPSPGQLEASAEAGAAVVELHTGAWCEAMRHGEGGEAQRQFARLAEGAAMAASLGLEVHAGHGLDYRTAGLVAALAQVVELNIGHFLVGEALFIGLERAIGRMRAAMDAGRPAP